MLSVIAAAVHSITPFSWPWIAAILPVILGSLVAIPMYLLARLYGGPVTGVTAAMVVTLAPVYTARSGLGWFDTDVMNLSWALLIVYCLHRFAFITSRLRYLWAAAGLGCTILFLWWWDQAPEVVVTFTAGTLATAVMFFYRPPRREGWIFFCVCGGLLLATLVWLGFDLSERILGTLRYISKSSTGAFPNIGFAVSEQERFSLGLLASETMLHWSAFLAALAGLVLMVIRESYRCLMLLILVIFGGLTFFAMRFAIFLVPLLGLGAGVLTEAMWNLRSQFKLMYLIAPSAMVWIFGLLVANSWRSTILPSELAPYIAGMTSLVTRTPDDAVVWAWWDHGYNLNFWARRATINDGSMHSGDRSVYNALPMATDSFRLSANFMRFYVVRGTSGMNLLYRAAGTNPDSGFRLAQRVLEAGPDAARTILEQESLIPINDYQNVNDWLEFFFPTNAPPVYLFLDQYTLRAAYWWYWFGTWDVIAKDGQHPLYIPLYQVKQVDENSLASVHGINVDLGQGQVWFTQGSYRPSLFRATSIRVKSKGMTLSEVNIHTKQGNKRTHFRGQGYRLDYTPQWNFATLSTLDLGNSVFNRLFVTQSFDPNYFKSVILQPGVVQVWEVTGDTLGDHPDVY